MIPCGDSRAEDERLFILALFGATFLMGASFIPGKILVGIADPFPLAGWRFIVAALATLPLCYWDLSKQGISFREGLLPPRSGWPALIAIGLLQTGLVMGLLFLSMETISASAAAILLFTNPLWVGLIAPVFLGDRLSPLVAGGLGVGVAGVAMAIGFDGLSNDPTGYLLGLGSGLAWAFSTILQKSITLTVRPFILAFWQMLIGGLALLMAAAYSGNLWIGSLTGWDWAWFIWLAIPSSTGSFGLWALALSKGGASRSSGFLFLAPFFAVLLSVLLLNTPMGLIQVTGGVMIALAIWTINRASMACRQ